MKYIIPAKTFLIGEYSALVGGSVLGLATGPGFEASYSLHADSSALPKIPFHESSPAGLLWKEVSKSDFKNTKIEMTELFNNLGGFGRSTAEYLTVLIPSLANKAEDFDLIRKKYQQLSLKSGAGASGADLAIQYFGDVTIVNGTKNSYSSAGWRFQDYDFILVSTGQKVKTHEHLAELNLNLIKTFPKISDPLVESYLTASAEDFISGVKEWSQFLADHSLTHSYSLELKSALEKLDHVLCVKPCGALGADVVVLFCQKPHSASVQKQLEAMNLVVQGTSADLISGVASQLPNQKNKDLGAPHVG